MGMSEWMKYVQKKGRDNEKKGTCHYSILKKHCNVSYIRKYKWTQVAYVK